MSAPSSNPYAVTTEHPSRQNDRPILRAMTLGTRICLFLIYLSVPLQICGALAAAIKIETIVVSGPIMLVYGIVLLILTWQSVVPRFRWFALTCLFYPVIVFLIIFTQGWSPDEAWLPISTLTGVLVLVFTSVLSAQLVYHRREFSQYGMDDPVDPREFPTAEGNPFATGAPNSSNKDVSAPSRSENSAAGPNEPPGSVEIW
ncbi:MAG: hypothetical protein HKN47_09035 [Pirellulaceae bacterium]|nr:hypothetical protein [Pirellulaceae bacterium]